MKLKLYKLTDQNSQTRNQTQWGEGVTHTTTGEGWLCSGGWLHAYEHPLLAVLLNPVHADFADPQLWEAVGGGRVLKDGQLKLGVTELTTVCQIPMPKVTTEQRVRFAILCAKAVCSDPAWNQWADLWLSGKDRSEAAAWSAREAAWSAAETAAWSAEAAAETAAWSAEAAAAEAWSAEAAAWSAEEAAAWSAWSADLSIDLVTLAQEAAAAAAEAARAADLSIDLVTLAQEAVSD